MCFGTLCLSRNLPISPKLLHLWAQNCYNYIPLYIYNYIYIVIFHYYPFTVHGTYRAVPSFISDISNLCLPFGFVDLLY